MKFHTEVEFEEGIAFLFHLIYMCIKALITRTNLQLFGNAQIFLPYYYIDIVCQYWSLNFVKIDFHELFKSDYNFVNILNFEKWSVMIFYCIFYSFVRADMYIEKCVVFHSKNNWGNYCIVALPIRFSSFLTVDHC